MAQDFLQDLEKQHEEAMADTSKQYMVMIAELPNTPMAEIIINPRPNFDVKVAYYKNAYNELGILKSNPNVKIIALKFVNDMEQAMEYVYNFS